MILSTLNSRLRLFGRLAYAALCTSLISLAVVTQAQTPFITVWDTNLPGESADNQITFPGNGFFYQIDWEEVGNPSNNGSVLGDFDQTTVTFPYAGVYRVSISVGFGFLSSFQMYYGGDEERLIDIEQWGSIPWISFGFAFSGCKNLTTITATDAPNLSNMASLSFMFSTCTQLTQVTNINTWDLSNISNMDGMFSHCEVFNQPIGGLNTSNVSSFAFMFESCLLFNQDLSTWDVSGANIMLGMFSFARKFNQDISGWNTENVGSMDMMFLEADSFNIDIGGWNTGNVGGMSDMFWSAESFNQDIGNWDVSNVITMHNMFFDAQAFNQDIGNWDVSRVTNMEGMFLVAPAFNQDISNWDVSSVTNMAQIFAFAESFDQDLSNWDVSKVTNMSEMFRGLPSFNAPLGNWDVQRVSNMHQMFESAPAFNQPLGGWQLRPGVNLTEMLDNSGMDCVNYSHTLTGWAGNPETPDNLSLGASTLTYGAGALASRNVLVSKGWTINDAGSDAGCAYDPEPFMTIWDTEQSGVSASNQILIPATGTNFAIAWEEVGNSSNGGTTTGNGNTTVTFPSPGIYVVRITEGSGTFEGLTFNGSGDKDKLLEVLQWGTADWTALANAFYGCTNLIISAVDVLNLTGVTSMENLFRGCSALRNVPNITAWSIGSVMSMEATWMDAPVFNQSLRTLQTGSVTSMHSMFEYASAFNQDISNWDVSMVEDMGRMFRSASSFDQNLEDWTTGSVETMEQMFYEAFAFDQNLGSWNLGSLDPMQGSMEDMLSFSGMECTNYSRSLIGWSAHPATPDDLILGAQGINYSPDAATAHADLTSTKNWTITDEGTDAGCILYSGDFITIWKSNNPGTSNNNQITIPGTGTNYSISWEDVNDPGTNGTQTGNGTTTVTFPSGGTYRVKINAGAGTFNRIFMAGAGDRLKLVEVENWGNIAWSTMDNAFNTCENLTISTQDTINLSSATSTRAMFQNCTSLAEVPLMNDWNMSTITTTALMFYNAFNFNEDISDWNVSAVMDMQYMFYQATAFNGDISGWNTGQVKNMSYMFNGASAFNQDIGNWNTANVTNMSVMFRDAFSFNQDLNWNTGKVTAMNEMFYSAIAFNGNISGWNTSKVKNMNFMFSGASVFNSDLSGWSTDSLNTLFGTFQNAVQFNHDLNNWNTSRVTTMSNLFENAVAFNGNISTWNTARVTQMGGVFKGASSFNQPIGSWQTGHVINMGLMFNGASAFNQDISNWQVDSVTVTALMFGNATSFNQDLSAWDVGRVTNAGSMFNGASAFNSNISNWNTGSITSMANMFANATAFDQDLGDWDIDQVTNFIGFLSGAGLSVANYDSLLIGWAAQSVQPGLTLDAGISQYCAGDSARTDLITIHGWTINDAGRNCCSLFTTWSSGTWDNGIPGPMHHAIFLSDYNTSLDGGGLHTCSVSIEPGVTVTIETNDTLRVESLLEVGGVLDVKLMGEVLLGE